MTVVLEKSVRRYTDEPGSGRVTSAVTATVVDGPIHLSAGKFNWEVDLPSTIGGGNLAPGPTAYLLGALAGCAVAFIKYTLAPEIGVRIDDVRAVARCGSDFGGLLGVEGSRPNLTDLAIEVTIDSPDGQDKIDQVTQAWLERSPIYLALLDPHEVSVSFTSADAQGAQA